VCRELGRHGGRTCYRAATADAAAWQLARRPKGCKLAAVPRLRTLVAEKLQQDWSPERDLAAADHQDARSRLVVTKTVTEAGNAV